MDIIITEEEIKRKIGEAGRYISEKYRGKPLLVVGILKGSFIFLADLVRKIEIPCEVGFMSVKSYCGTESTGSVEIVLDLQQDISNYNVVIAEDIIDTGRTLQKVCRLLRERRPLSLEIVTLLDKPSRREVDLEADYVLFEIEDRFVVGYGLDYDERYRNLPHIGELGVRSSE